MSVQETIMAFRFTHTILHTGNLSPERRVLKLERYGLAKVVRKRTGNVVWTII